MERHQATTLRVLHRPRDAAGDGLHDNSATMLRQRGFFLDTCLRQLAVMVAPRYPDISIAETGLQKFSGHNAYSFLLQTATGLNSSVPGESNILGQFKRGWNAWRDASDAEQVCKLNSYMHALFLDSRRIRREHLQGIGGSSYGSLVRKLLHPEADAQILFVGTGGLTHSMLPLFAGFTTAVWNHRNPALSTLAATPAPAIADQRWFAPADAARAANWATHIVITAPADKHNDQVWATMAGPLVKHVVHLGRRRAAPGIWSETRHNFQFSNLDDVFDLRRAQSSLRTLQIVRARKACEQLAISSDNEVDKSAVPASVVAQSA